VDSDRNAKTPLVIRRFGRRQAGLYTQRTIDRRNFTGVDRDYGIAP